MEQFHVIGGGHVNPGERHCLIITVDKIQGRCPVFKVGDKIVVEPPKLVIDETNNLCIHAFSCIISMLIPLNHEASFKQLGLAKEKGEKGYFQFLDPGEPYTHG